MGLAKQRSTAMRWRDIIHIVLVVFLIITALAVNNVTAQPAEREPQFDPNHYRPSDNPCYDERNVPQRCVPDFINAAFNLEVEVTNTCGVRQPTRFCVQTGHMGIKKVCDVCDARVPQFAHSPNYLTDFNNPENETWWQSETILDGIQYPNHVNLTLRLGKAFDITYVRLKFISPRPESFRIYKKGHADDEWVPWAYYSGSCRSTYKLPEKAPILPGNEAVAQCTREFSDISPLTGGNIAFPTLEGRPSAENFEESEVLQAWVTATEIRVVLDRLNTFGDEIFGDPRVLRSYYYAISDFAVGGRCKCNGHASQCVKSTGAGEQLVCDCKHHTTGVDCQQCEPFYVDRPWRPATSSESNECLPCDCNGLSNRCFSDAKLYEETGHGGHCVDCAGNTRGPHCEECLPNHWRRVGEHYCVPCHCNEIGSVDTQCNANAQCQCKPGVGGQFCDRCENGFYDFSASGCQDCRCEVAGSHANQPNCSPTNGACACKMNVEGQRCDKCKPGYFHLAVENQFGCTPCFCYGHSSVCTAADGFYAANITSLFDADVEHWTASSDVRPEDVQWAQIDQAAAVSQIDDNPVYFYAPKQYLGDQRFIYNQDMEFTLRTQLANPARSQRDIVLVGASGHELFTSITAQNNPLPTTTDQRYRFRIHANSHLQWNPTIREMDFIGILSNISAIKIRGTYSKGDVAFLSDFRIGSATATPDSSSSDVLAPWVESCKCTEGFVGQFCESCAHGYKRARPFGGALTKCIKCDCHDHSDACDAESGVCICAHNTAGDTCERCARGYYGDALVGTEDDCKKCDCPDGGPCVLLSDGDTICTECPDGYTGRKCDSCADEYFGDPLHGADCRKCECNGNTDANSIGNCDTLTGECKKCIFHTTGFNCDHCTAGYWGDALAETKGDCEACNCYPPGTIRPIVDHTLLECQQSDGQCDCQPNVIGRQCDQCAPGFFNLTSGSGCENCDCDILGSLNGTCDVNSGQCYCKPGITGRRCDQCQPRYFGFGVDGCFLCDCDVLGAETPDCDVRTGQCLCKDNVEGRRCDQCSENRFSLQRGCLACDDCYTLIQTRKNEINASISALSESLDEIQNNPVTVNDSEFDAKVSEVKATVQQLYDKADKKLDGSDQKMQLQVNDIKQQFENADETIRYVDGRLAKIDEKSALVEFELQRINADKQNVQVELNNAISHVRAEGQAQLAKAERAADRYGDKSKTLSEMAEQAKLLADRQEERNKEIKALAERACNASKEALNEANEAIFGATSTSQQIENLKAQVTDAKRQLEGVHDLAGEQLVETAKIHDSGAHILSSVESIKLPAIDTEAMSSNAVRVRTEADDALAEVQKESAEAGRLMTDTQAANADAQREVANVRRKQQEAESLLEEVEKYHNRARQAFELATKIWNEARDAHDDLSDFNDKVVKNREDALEELRNLPEIEKELNEAELLTREAEEAVGDAKSNADDANRIAAEAKIKANNLIQESEQLINAAEKIKSDAEARRNAVDKLSSSIDSLQDTSNNFENQALSDAEKSQRALRKATVAESNARNLQRQLQTAEQSLYDALDQLNSLENVDDNQLAELERLLEESERSYERSAGEQQLKERVQQAEEEKDRERQQIDELRRELDNLVSISNALPTKCFNLVNLEQEGQKRR